MRVAIYVRVSTDGQAEDGTSLDTQERACREYAAKQGATVMAVYRETYSGYTRERPELARLREVVREGAADAVIVYAVDRLSRNQTDLAVLVDELQTHRVQLLCVTEPLEMTAVGKFLLTARAFAAEVEREKIKERSMRGRVEAAKRGKLVANPSHTLYGYRFITGEGRREIDAATAPIVRDVFHWIANEGMTLNAVTNRLNERGIPTPTGVPRWRMGTIAQMAHNEAYTGRDYFLKTKLVPVKRPRKPGAGRNFCQERPREEWIPIEGATPSIITRELFDAVQEQIKRNAKHATRNARNEYLLSGHIVCGDCGSHCAGRFLVNGSATKKGHFYYRCNDTFRTTPQRSCKSKYVRLDVVEPLVWNYICDILRTPALVVAAVEQQRAEQGETNVERDLASVRTQLDRLIAKERKLLSLALSVEDDEESTELFQREQRSIKEQRDRLRAEEDRLLARTRQEVITADTIADVEAYCAQVAGNLDGLTFEEKRRILDALHIRVTIEDQGATLHIHGFVPSHTIGSTVHP